MFGKKRRKKHLFLGLLLSLILWAAVWFSSKISLLPPEPTFVSASASAPYPSSSPSSLHLFRLLLQKLSDKYPFP